LNLPINDGGGNLTMQEMSLEKRVSRLEQLIRNIQARLSDMEKENAGIAYRVDAGQSAVVESTLKHIQVQIDKLEKDITSLNYRVDENFSDITDLSKAVKKTRPDSRL
jgi:predicted  nucleic acid-binding Zn-ribbon protein